MNHYNLDNFEYTDNADNIIIFKPVVKNNKPLYIINNKLVEADSINGIDDIKLKNTHLKAFKLIAINDHIEDFNLVIPYYICKNLKKTHRNIFNFIEQQQRKKWWENTNEQTILSKNKKIEYTIQPVFRNGKIKNNFPKYGKYMNVYLVTAINGIKLSEPFETTFKIIEAVILGKKNYIQHPIKQYNIEFLKENKKNIFKKLEKNLFRIIIYKNIDISNKNIDVNYNKIHTYQRNESKNIPEAEIIINNDYVSQKEKIENKRKSLILKSMVIFKSDFDKTFKNVDSGGITYNDIKSFIKTHNNFKNCGFQLEKEIEIGLNAALSDYDVKAQRTISPFVSDIKLKDFYIESKLDYGTAPLLHTSIFFDDMGYIHGTEKFKIMNHNSLMEQFYDQLHRIFIKIIDNSKKFQQMKNKFETHDIKFSNIRHWLKTNIQIFENDKNKYTYEPDKLNVKTKKLIDYIASLKHKSVTEFTLDDKVNYIFMNYLSTTTDNRLRKGNFQPTRKMLDEIITDSASISDIASLIHYYYYNINNVKYLQVGNDTYIMNRDDDPLHLLDNYDIPQFRDVISSFKVDIDTIKSISKFRLSIRFKSQYKNGIHFNVSPNGTQITKVHI